MTSVKAKRTLNGAPETLSGRPNLELAHPASRLRRGLLNSSHHRATRGMYA